MRRFVLLVWLLLPVLVGFYHAGPGQEGALLDRINQHLQDAQRAIANADRAVADEAYSQALALLPADRTEESRRIRLERAKNQMLNRQLPTAHQELKSLVDEMTGDASSKPQLVADARQALANAQYYMTWLMRLEGQPKDRWEPEIEGARQAYRLLAERAEGAGEPEQVQRNREDLESAIRLARMDLSDLQGLPIPSQ